MVEDGGETVYGAGVDVVDVMIEFQLSSLYSKSSVCVLTVTAFTEGKQVSTCAFAMDIIYRSSC